MSKKSNEYWLDLIHQCRESGLTDRQWCIEKNLSFSTFYYHIRSLRKKACELPAPNRHCTMDKRQEVVALKIMDEPVLNTSVSDVTAVRLQINGICMEISNHASAATITHTLQALKNLC